MLNRLSRDKLFIVIKGVDFIKQAPDLKMPELSVAKSGSAVESASTGDNDTAEAAVKKAVKEPEKVDVEHDIRQKRRVSGPNVDTPMIIHVDMDVYTFFLHNIEKRIEKSN